MSNTNGIVQKLWSYCNVLRDDGLSYQDYLEQLTFLLFLKMAEERAELTGKEQPVPAGYRWCDLASPNMEGARLEEHYRTTLRTLGQQSGMLGLIFRKAQNKIQDPANLRRLIVELIGKENWSRMSADVKGDAYEGVLEKNAQDVKGGAGQYFTPRGLIRAIVDVIRPAPGELVVDPACGTGGFLLAAHDFLARSYELDRDDKKHLRYDALRGIELVDGVSRLCAMNLLLHGIGPDDDRREPPIVTDDALRNEPAVHADVVMTNPPFGKKSSITVVNAEGETGSQSLTYNRVDFWTTTSNKQLNFVQHVKSLLKINGRAAVVVPDNVLFEGGAGETVRRRLLHECEVHTLLRLPTGIFYAQGVKANVLFFDRKPGAKEPWTKKLWVYDLRTNKHFTLKQNRLSRSDLDEFVDLYRPENRHQRQATWSEETPEGRWRCFGYEELLQRDKVSLDLFWLRDESLEDSASLPDPHVLAEEIADDLRSALGQIEDILADLQERANGQHNLAGEEQRLPAADVPRGEATSDQGEAIGDNGRRRVPHSKPELAASATARPQPPAKRASSTAKNAETPEKGQLGIQWPSDAPFLSMGPAEQAQVVWEALFGLGPIEWDLALREALATLEEKGLMGADEDLHETSPLRDAVENAFATGLEGGRFDEPYGGLVRAILTDPRDYTDEFWKLCLREGLAGKPDDEDEAIRQAAEWARENLGLAFQRIRRGGVLHSSLARAMRHERGN